MSSDRLSELPHSLLLSCVLNRLELKEAVTTCLLSKRWRSLWVDLPSLDFQEKSKYIAKKRRFVSFVHSALVNRTDNYLDEFSVEFKYREWFASDVNTWLEFAANYKTKKLSLLLLSGKHKHFYELPQMMYSNSSLEHVSLERCNLAPPRNSIEWPSLRSLEIGDAWLPQHLIENILSNCPVLDTLKVSLCGGFSCLDIKSERLCHLDICGWSRYGSEGLLEICAPNLQSLDLCMTYPKKQKVHLKDISSVGRASLDLYVVSDGDGDDDYFDSEEMMSKVKQLFQQVQHVKCLTLGNDVLETVSRMKESGWWLPRSSVQELTVKPAPFTHDRHAFCGIISLLESSPKLEYLTISCYSDFFDSSEKVIPWAAEDEMVGDLFNLKTIYIFGCSYRYCELLLAITRILLKRAIVLEKMEIYLYHWSPECFSEITQKLQDYPRSSHKAQLSYTK